MYSRSLKWEALLDLDRERESFADTDDERVVVLHEIARIEVDELGDSQEGIVTYRRILEVDPVNAEAVSRLDQLLEGAERWDELGSHIEFQIDNASDARAALALRQRLGSLTETELQSPAQALEIFEDVLADQPDYAPALGAVSRLVEDEDHGPRAVQILEPIHRESGDWQALVSVLDAKARQAVDAFEQAETWREVGRLHEERGHDEEKAFDAWW